VAWDLIKMGSSAGVGVGGMQGVCLHRRHMRIETLNAGLLALSSICDAQWWQALNFN